MVEALFWEDYLTIGLYFAVVIGVGLWVSSESPHPMHLYLTNIGYKDTKLCTLQTELNQ